MNRLNPMKNTTNQPPATGEAAHTIDRLHLDACPDADGFQTIRPDDGTENGDTEMNPIATVYAGPRVAAFIVRACNSHAALVEALHNTERTLSALASSELTIDEDRNRTPLRLAQRNDVWRAIESARALLAEIGGDK